MSCLQKWTTGQEKSILHRLNTESSSKCLNGCPGRQTPDEDWKTQRPKRCDSSDNDESFRPTVNSKSISE